VRPVSILVAFLPVMLDSARTLAGLLAALLAFGTSGGLLAVSNNAQAVLVERGYRRPLMASFHASYSIGGLSGALLGGILAGAGTAATCFAVALPAAIVAAAAGRCLLAEPAGLAEASGGQSAVVPAPRLGLDRAPDPQRRSWRPARARARLSRARLSRASLSRADQARLWPGGRRWPGGGPWPGVRPRPGGRSRPGGRLRPGARLRPGGRLRSRARLRSAGRSRPGGRPWPGRPWLRRPGHGRGARRRAQEAGSGSGSPRFMALGLLALCCLVSEGTAGNWSAVYLRNNLRIPSGFAVSGFAAFSVAMTVGRLLGDRLAARFGPVRLVRGCGLLAATGLAGGLVSEEPVAAVAGFALFGAGLSCTIPQLLSAAGNADPDQPGTGLARVSALGYVGLVGGPVLIGACAGLTGLPLALGIPVVLGLFVAAGARVLDPLRRPGSAARLEGTRLEGTRLESTPPESASPESVDMASPGRTDLHSRDRAQAVDGDQVPLESADRTAQEGHRRVVAADRAHSAAAAGARTAEHEPGMPGLHAPRARVGRLVSPRP